MSSRFTGAIVKVIQGDAVNPRGLRNIIDGDGALLDEFEFNKNSKSATTFSVPFTASIDRSAGTLTVDVPSFIPANVVSSPEGATHFRLKVGGAAIDFEGNTYPVTTSESTDLTISQEVQGPLHFSQRVTPGSFNPLFLVFGVEFLQLVNGTQYPLNNSAFNAMAIVKVDGRAADESQVPASAGKARFLVKSFKRISQHAMIRFPDSKVLGIRLSLSKPCSLPEESAENPRDGPIYNVRGIAQTM